MRAQIFIFILTALYFLLPFPAFAQTPASPAALPAYVSPISPLYTDLLVHNLFHSFSCLAVGQSVIGQPCLTYQVSKNAQGAIQSVPVLSQVNTGGGVLGTTTSLIGMLYTNQPVRTVDYLGSLGEQFGVIKTANAQVVGSGEKVLNPILRLWQVSRNISYVIMIVIFVIIGIMIMFRHKINPQTVITAQAALPGLVIGLIMITFSYFLAGLISDMAFVGTNIVGYYFQTVQNIPQESLVQKLSGSNILDIMGSMAGIIQSGDVATISGRIFEALGDDAKGAVRWLVFWLSTQFISNLVPTDLSANPWALVLKPFIGIVGGGATTFFGISPLLGQLLSFAAALALIYQMFKLLLKLISAWLTIIFLTITAPFQFLFAALPGRQGIATGWILNMLGNILIFPAIIAVIYFVAFLLGSEFTKNCPKDSSGQCLIRVSAANHNNNNAFISPAYADTYVDTGNFNVIGPNTFPMFGGIDLRFVKILLAFGALMALPTIPDIIIRTVGKAGQAGQMIGQEIMGGANFGRGYAQQSYGQAVNLGQASKSAVFGETQVNAAGEVVLTRQGLIRHGQGTVSEAGAGAVRWGRPSLRPKPPV